MSDLRTPSYSTIAKAAKRKRRAHGPLGIAIPETDNLLAVKWTGPVERRPVASYRLRSVHLTWRCSSCRSWTMNGAWKYARCNWCSAARPPLDIDPWS